MRAAGAMVVSTCLLLAAGCRPDPMLEPDEGIHTAAPAAEDRLSFQTTGLQRGFWFYRDIVARWEPAMGVTQIETFGDSTLHGKLVARFRGGREGRFVYHLEGLKTDTNDVHIRFIPSYRDGIPTGVYELTGDPLDQLEAEVVIRHYGEVGDTIAGTMVAWLKRTAAPVSHRILLYGGDFSVTRRQ